MLTANEVSNWVRSEFPVALAESWDAVGDVCGRGETRVTGVLVCVDVTADTVREALERGANYILAHHPLLLTGVTSVAPTNHKGALLHELIENRMSLHVAHTNADIASPGVSDALARALSVRPLEPLAAIADQLDKVVTFVPAEHAQAVLTALSEAGAGHIGDYDRCAFFSSGQGTFRPLLGAKPHIGEIGRITDVAEVRLELVSPRAARSTVVAALRRAHPYEEPAFDVLELAPIDGQLGLGRIGNLPDELTLAQFAGLVADALPVGASGVRVAGDPTKPVSRVAVCGGSGDSLLSAAAARGADVFVTSDLKHHKVSEFVADHDCALIDVSHFASEFPWCVQTAARLEHALSMSGDSIAVTVSSSITDPWQFRQGD